MTVSGDRKLLTRKALLAGFKDLTLVERDFLQRVLVAQHSKRVPDGGWVPPMDLGGGRKNKVPMRTLSSLTERGFLKLIENRFNGRRFKLPYHLLELPGEN